MTAPRMDPEFSKRLLELGPPRDLPRITTALEYRARADAYIGALLNFSIPNNIIETKHTISSYDGAQIEVYRFTREGVSDTTPEPALVYAHGGGVVACGIGDVTKPGVAQLVAECGVQAFAVEYRMAPEHPYPTPVEDCYAALKWLVNNAEKLAVDPSRITIAGESGGAGLAIGVSFLARDRGLTPPLAKQVLIYPMLDDMSPTRATAKEDSPRTQFLSDYINYTQICWKAYLGAERAGNPDADVPYYASPSRATNVVNLPPTYIDVGTLDLFLDESLAFASKLADADIAVELHVYDGLPHCFDIIAPNIAATRNAKDNRIRAICNV